MAAFARRRSFRRLPRGHGVKSSLPSRAFVLWPKSQKTPAKRSWSDGQNHNRYRCISLPDAIYHSSRFSSLPGDPQGFRFSLGVCARSWAPVYGSLSAHVNFLVKNKETSPQTRGYCTSVFVCAVYSDNSLQALPTRMYLSYITGMFN